MSTNNTTYTSQTLASNGTQSGILTVADTSDFRVGAMVFLTSSAVATKSLTVDEILSTTTIAVKDTTGYSYARYDCSSYLVADSATLTQPVQEDYVEDAAGEPASDTSAGTMSAADYTKLSDISGVTTAAMTLYVATTGSDTNAGTSAAPFLTIQAAIDSVPKNIKHPVTINVGAGNFAGFEIGNFNIQRAAVAASGAFINIVGTLATATGLATGSATGTATAGTAGTNFSTTWGTLTDGTQTWTVNNLRGKIIETLTGTGALQTAVIYSNTATAITIVGSWTAPGNGTTYAIRDWGTVINTALAQPAELTLSTTTSSTSTVGTTANVGFWIHDNLNAGRAASFANVSVQRIKTSALHANISGPGTTNIKLYAGGGTTFGISIAGNATLAVYQSYINAASLGIFAQGNVSGSGLALSVNTSLFNAGSSAIVLSGSAVSVNNSGFLSQAASGISTNRNNWVDVTGCQFSSITGSAIGLTAASVPNVVANGLFQVSNTSISSCGVGIGVSGPGSGLYAVSGVTGSGNTVGWLFYRGASAQIGATGNTLTGTTEVSIDGTSSDLATMRAATPKLVTNTYGTIFFE